MPFSCSLFWFPKSKVFIQISVGSYFISWHICNPFTFLKARKNLLDLNLASVSVDESVDLEEIAKMLDAYSGADIMSFCRDAALMSMRKMIKGINEYLGPFISCCYDFC